MSSLFQTFFFLFLSLVFSSGVQARTVEDTPPGSFPEVTFLGKPSRESSSGLSYCQEKEEENAPLLLEEARSEYLERLGDGGRLISKRISGVLVRGTRSDLEIAKKMLETSDPFQSLSEAEQTSPSGWKDAPKFCPKNKNQSIELLCALTRAFQNEESAYRVLSIARKSGYILSLSQDTNRIHGLEQVWSLRQIRLFSEVLDEVPSRFLHLKGLESLFLVADELADSKNNSTAGLSYPAIQDSYGFYSGKIVFYGRFMTANWNDIAIKETMAHELAHQFNFDRMRISGKDYYATNFKDCPDALKNEKGECFSYQDLSWEEKTLEDGKTSWIPKVGIEFVRPYAKSHPTEDFADSVSYYLYLPDHLKKVDPRKYFFIQENLFEGKEWMEPYAFSNFYQFVLDSYDYQGALNACSEGLTSLTKLSDRYLFIRKNGGRRSFEPYLANSFEGSDLSTHCLDSFYEDALAQIQTHPLYCVLGGKSNIRGFILNHFEARTQALLKEAEEKEAALALKEELPEKTCALQGDYRKECAIEKGKSLLPLLVPELSDGLIMPLTEQLFSPSKRLQAFFELNPPAQLVMDYLLKTKKIEYSSEPFQVLVNYLEISHSSYPAYSFFWNFRDYLSEKGIQVDDEFISTLLMSAELNQAMKGFLDLLETSWAGIKEGCQSVRRKKDRKLCEQRALESLLLPWAQAHGSKTPFITGELLEHLLKNVKNVKKI